MDTKKLRFILKNAIGMVLLFFSIMFVGVAINNYVIIVLDLIITPFAIYFLNKKTNLKKSIYYGGLTGLLCVTFIIACVLQSTSQSTLSAKQKKVGTESTVDKESNKPTDTTMQDTKNIVTDTPESTPKSTPQETKTTTPTSTPLATPEVTPTIEPTATPEPATPIEAQVHFINTGNSDSILIIQGNVSILIDAGDNDDEGLVTNYIRNQGIDTLNYVISTHPDADHCGGLDAVVQSIGVENLFVANGSADTKTYQSFISAAINKGLQPSVPLDGAKYPLTETSSMTIYNTNGGSDSNECSLVILYENGTDKLLFMGDAGISTEQEISGSLVDVDLVKIGHHGSDGSTGESFLNQVNPEYAVILTGPNSYGHPTSIVMDRLKERNIEVHRTDECGNVVFISTGHGLSTNCPPASYEGGEQETVTSQEKPETSVATEAPVIKEPVKDETVNTGELVVITMQGEKYHKPNCRTIKQEKERISKQEAIARGYEPCKVCKP